VGSGRVDPCFLIGRVELGFFKLGQFFGFALGFCGFSRVFVKNHDLRCIDRVGSGWVFSSESGQASQVGWPMIKFMCSGGSVGYFG
jgi:hypothetical protein